MSVLRLSLEKYMSINMFLLTMYFHFFILSLLSFPLNYLLSFPCLYLVLTVNNGNNFGGQLSLSSFRSSVLPIMSSRNDPISTTTHVFSLSPSLSYSVPFIGPLLLIGTIADTPPANVTFFLLFLLLLLYLLILSLSLWFLFPLF